MGRIVAWNLMTLDGRFEGGKPWDLDFHVWGPELEALSLDIGRRADALLFGRRTYEGMAAYWRTATGPIADMMNTLPKLVASRTLTSVDWSNSRLLEGDAVASLGDVKRDTARDIYVFGSAGLLAALLPAGLVDEYWIGLVPATLGEGRPLFPPGLPPQRFRLLGAQPLEIGAVILRYAWSEQG